MTPIQMKFLATATLIFVWVLAGCSDGVPKVDNPHAIMVDGKKMTPAAFLQTYCTAKGNNETCLKVVQAMRSDATKGVIPKGW